MCRVQDFYVTLYCSVLAEHWCDGVGSKSRWLSLTPSNKLRTETESSADQYQNELLQSVKVAVRLRIQAVLMLFGFCATVAFFSRSIFWFSCKKSQFVCPSKFKMAHMHGCWYCPIRHCVIVPLPYSTGTVLTRSQKEWWICLKSISQQRFYISFPIKTVMVRRLDCSSSYAPISVEARQWISWNVSHFSSSIKIIWEHSHFSQLIVFQTLHRYVVITKENFVKTGATTRGLHCKALLWKIL